MIHFTQKMRGTMMMAAFILFGLSTSAQTFTHETPYEDILVDEGDTLNWSIPATTNLGWGSATITIYYEGDFGGGDEFITLYGENNTLIGVTHPYVDGSDCFADSATFTFPVSWINSWTADNVIEFFGVTSGEVNLFCDSNHAKIKLEYNYCLTGPIASLQIPQTAFCEIDNLVNVNVAPAGGTFSGPNFSAAGFNPQGLMPGTYPLTYTYTNPSGCTSYDSVNVTIKPGSLATTDKDTVCISETATLTAFGTGHVYWFTDLGLTNSVGTTNTFNTPALSNTTSFYAATVHMENYFTINSFTVNDSVVIDHDGLSGDDRGGIAVTNEYVYIVGDDSTARYDLDLQNGESFPRVDGLFSDLGNGQLYTLYNPIVGIPDANNIDSMYITEIRTLNADLTLGSGTITLSDSIAFGWDSDYNYQSGIFAGNGFLLLYSSPQSSWFVVDLQDGIVTNLGLLPNFYGSYSENWAFWGIAEFTESGYSAIYRDDNSTNIVRKGLPDQTPTILASFNDISDMASLTYAPWNNRWYFHFEGGGDFDPNYDYNEALGYATASDSTGSAMSVNSSACPAEVTVVVDKPTVNLTGGGSICINDAAVAVVGTPAGGVYAGTGLTGNSFNPSTAGIGTHEITYTITNAAGCSNTDTVTYVVNCTAGIDENTAQNIRMYPNPANESMFVDLGEVNSTSTLKVFDAAGRLIINQNANATSTVKIDVSNLEVGTYIMQISGEVNTRKVFIIAR